jgi:hypothetical protein
MSINDAYMADRRSEIRRVHSGTVVHVRTLCNASSAHVLIVHAFLILFRSFVCPPFVRQLICSILPLCRLAVAGVRSSLSPAFKLRGETHAQFHTFSRSRATNHTLASTTMYSNTMATLNLVLALLLLACTAAVNAQVRMPTPQHSG